MAKNKKQVVRSTLKGNTNKPKAVNPKMIKASLYIAQDFGDNIRNEILDVLASTPFSKISFPIGTYRYHIQDNIADDDNRIITVGYIKSYDPETCEFTIIMFNDEVKDKLKAAGDLLCVEVLCTTYATDKLGKITRLNVVPMYNEYSEEDDECEEEPAEEEEVSDGIAEEGYTSETTNTVIGTSEITIDVAGA